MKVKEWFVKNQQPILFGLAIGGMVATTAVTVYCTVKVVRVTDTKKKELGKEKLTAKEFIKATWPYYIPVAALLGGTVASAVGANHHALKKAAVMSAAYTATEGAFTAYKEKVKETLGEKKTEKLEQELAQDKIDKTPMQNDIPQLGGNTLMLDTYAGRYFYSSMNKVESAVNFLNSMLLSDGIVSLNDFYDYMGLDRGTLGDEFVWDTDNNYTLITLKSMYGGNGNGEPCKLIEFSPAPKPKAYY